MNTQPDLTIIAFRGHPERLKKQIERAESYIRKGEYKRYEPGVDRSGSPYVDLFKE